jgi:hypothetical protein
VSLLLRLERRIEALVEGVFARWARDRVHPIEIARRLFRTMDEGAVAGLDGLIVPNVYQVFLAPKDFAPYADLAASLSAELASALAARAEELGASLPGTVCVALGARDEITPGAIYVEARLVPDADASATADTRIYRRRDEVLRVRLRVLAGPPGAAGLEFVGAGPVVTIGRRADQDIVLNDPSVSRAHARIDIERDGAEISDVGSTNGTLVNGRPSGGEALPLRAGDRVQLGTVLLEIIAGP